MSSCLRQDKEGPRHQSAIEEQQGERSQPPATGVLAVDQACYSSELSKARKALAYARCVSLTCDAKCHSPF